MCFFNVIPVFEICIIFGNFLTFCLFKYYVKNKIENRHEIVINLNITIKDILVAQRAMIRTLNVVPEVSSIN